MSVANDLDEESAVFTRPDRKVFTEIEVKDLDLSPWNKRKEYKITPEFCRSLQALQEHPLIVFPAPEGADVPYWVYDGNRRLMGARQAGMQKLECIIDFTLTADKARQLIGQVTTAEQREGLSPQEVAEALFDAVEAGATRTEIWRKTGFKAATLRTALKASRLPQEVRDKAAAANYDWTLEDYALLAEFEGDNEATDQIMEMINRGRNTSVKYAVEYVRNERAELAAYQALVEQLTQAGIPITEDIPDGAVRVDSIGYQVKDFDSSTHHECAGHTAHLRGRSTRPSYWCTTPAVHGYSPPRYEDSRAQRPKADPEERRRVIAGNKAWKAAAGVRHDWLRQLFARSTAPKHTFAFITRMLMTMPEPVRDRLASASNSELWAKFAGKQVDAEAVATARPGKMQLLALLPIAVAFEHQMTLAGEARNTWRSDKWSPCTPADARRWLEFLIEAGYKPCPIEQAVAYGLPYVGDDIDYAASTAESLAAASAELDDSDETASASVNDRGDGVPINEPTKKPDGYDPDAFVDPDLDGDMNSDE
ncbi:UNVERIFIED_ORG: ParB family chromosome partitioning protein [Microbispora rosea subsp. rosea]